MHSGACRHCHIEPHSLIRPRWLQSQRQLWRGSHSSAGGGSASSDQKRGQNTSVPGAAGVGRWSGATAAATPPPPASAALAPAPPAAPAPTPTSASAGDAAAGAGAATTAVAPPPPAATWPGQLMMVRTACSTLGAGTTSPIAGYSPSIAPNAPVMMWFLVNRPRKRLFVRPATAEPELPSAPKMKGGSCPSHGAATTTTQGASVDSLGLTV